MYIHERYFAGLTQGEEGRGREKREEEGGRKIQKVFAFLHCSSTTMHNKAVKASILKEITGANNTYPENCICGTL